METGRAPLHVYNEFELDAGLQPSAKQGRPCPGQPSTPEQTNAQRWLQQLASDGDHQLHGREALYALLRGKSRGQTDRTAAIINQSREWISRVYPAEPGRRSCPSDGGAAAAASTGGESAAGLVSRADKARAVQYMYERTLHHVLLLAISRAQGAAGGELAQRDRQASVDEVLLHADLQIGIINACLEVVNYCCLEEPSHAFPYTTLLLGRIHNTIELWQGIDWVTDVLAEATSGNRMPEDVVRYLAAIQVRIEEELAFIDGSSLFSRLLTAGITPPANNDCYASSRGVVASNGKAASRRRGGKSTRSPNGGTVVPFAQPVAADVAITARFVSNMANTVMLRTKLVTDSLLEEFPALREVPDLGPRTASLVDVVLCDHLELLFGQHASVVLACATYLTLRAHGCTAVPFAGLTHHMAALLPQHSAAVFERVAMPPLEPSASDWGMARDDAEVFGDARQFYNIVFLPAMSGYSASELFDVDGATVGSCPSAAGLLAVELLRAPAAEEEACQAALTAALPANARSTKPAAAAAAARTAAASAPQASRAETAARMKDGRRQGRKPLATVTANT